MTKERQAGKEYKTMEIRRTPGELRGLERVIKAFVHRHFTIDLFRKDKSRKCLPNFSSISSRKYRLFVFNFLKMHDSCP